MVLTVPKHRTDKSDLLGVANAFVAGSEHRLNTFVVFNVLDRAHSQRSAHTNLTQTSTNIGKRYTFT